LRQIQVESDPFTALPEYEHLNWRKLSNTVFGLFGVGQDFTAFVNLRSLKIRNKHKSLFTN